MNAAEFVGKLKGVTRNGDGWQARCPAHDDKSPSLSVSTGADGRILLHCHTGCSYEAILRVMGLKESDLFAQGERRQGTGGKQIVARYNYRDAEGNLLFQCVRFEPKDFRQRRPDPAKPSGWIWDLRGVPLVLYRLPELRDAVADSRTIFIAEGEKDVGELVKFGLDATCNPMGAGKWRPEYTESLRGAASAVVVADKDAPGRKHARQVASALRGVVGSVKVVELPDRDGKTVKDAHDFFAAGGNVEELKTIVNAALEFNPEEGEPDSPPDPSPTVRSLFDLELPPGGDPNELLMNRYLCAGGGLLLCGPTGVGKSSFAIQAVILWALCKPFMGIKPKRPLKSCLIQAENDDCDLAEMRDGILAQLNLTDAEKAQARGNVLVLREQCKTGATFCNEVAKPMLEEHCPDLFWFDPALAYLGGDANSQKDVGAFLRNSLNPLLEANQCAAVIIHHTNKPPKDNRKGGWQAGEMSYLGSGSSEWANWARAILVIQSLGSPDVFELCAPKRGKRLGWTAADGVTPAVSKLMAHAKGGEGIFWREVGEDERPVKVPEEPKHTKEQFLALVPGEKEIAKNLLLERAQGVGIGINSARDYIKELVADGTLHEWKRKRSRKNDEILLARRPQPEGWQ